MLSLHFLRYTAEKNLIWRSGASLTNNHFLFSHYRVLTLIFDSRVMLQGQIRTHSSWLKNKTRSPLPRRLYHWCSLLTPQQNTKTTNQHGARFLSFAFAFSCLLHTFTLSVLLGNFALGFENFRFGSGVISPSLLLLSESLNFVSVLNFGLTLGEDSSVVLIRSNKNILFKWCIPFEVALMWPQPFLVGLGLHSF